MTVSKDRLGALVDDMLEEAGQDGSDGLRDLLMSLGGLQSLPAPAPSRELAALMADGEGIPGQAEVKSLAAHRRRHLRRNTALGLALIAGMGVGAGSVAASPQAGGGAGTSVQHLLEGWVPWSIPARAAAGALSEPMRPELQPQHDPRPGMRAAGDPLFLDVEGSPRPPRPALEIDDADHDGPAPPASTPHRDQGPGRGQPPGIVPPANAAPGTPGKDAGTGRQAGQPEGGSRPQGGGPAGGTGATPDNPVSSLYPAPTETGPGKAGKGTGEDASRNQGSPWLEKFKK
ncbi:hypothetical protein JHV56_01495 [Arthrobacter sp. BHU FT2]|nr:hypothetical protein [Arthrobacter sp. BHU FT2]